jgi:anaerobic magnesium-protoporphyrin IX monomethyl ester cyclase
MRILLVNPPIPASYYNTEFYLPSGLLYLAAVLRDQGEEVRILEMKTFTSESCADSQTLYEGKLQEALLTFKPDLIGMGCLFSGNFPQVLTFSGLCKQLSPQTPIIVGGIHVTIHARDVLQHCPGIDWLALGEAEETIIQLVRTMKSGSAAWDAIEGFAYRSEGQVVVNAKQRYIHDIDQIPFPAYDLVNIEDYYVDTSHWYNPKHLTFSTSIPIVSSRSCPHRCTFCSMYRAMGQRWRARSAENVVNEIEIMYHRYGQTHFSFMDDNFTFNKERTLTICHEIVKRGLDIQFETPNGLSMKTLDEEVLDALVEAGLIRVSLAIESGSDFIRNRIMRKNLSQEKIYDVIRLTKSHEQLYVKAFFIIGMPEETLDTLEQSYEMIQTIDVDRVYIQNVLPFPGTSLFKQAVRDGLLVDVDVERLYQDDGMYITNWKRFFIKPYQLDIEQLQQFRLRCEPSISKHPQAQRLKIRAGQAAKPEFESSHFIPPTQ